MESEAKIITWMEQSYSQSKEIQFAIDESTEYKDLFITFKHQIEKTNVNSSEIGFRLNSKDGNLTISTDDAEIELTKSHVEILLGFLNRNS